jgi:hypothetical protein
MRYDLSQILKELNVRQSDVAGFLGEYSSSLNQMLAYKRPMPYGVFIALFTVDIYLHEVISNNLVAPGLAEINAAENNGRQDMLKEVSKDLEYRILLNQRKLEKWTDNYNQSKRAINNIKFLTSVAL